MGGTQSATPLLSSNSVSSSLTSVQVERRTKSQDEKRIRTMTRLITAKAIRDNGQEKEDHEYTQENIQLLKHLFKKMDPSVMRTSAQSNHGEIQLSFKYEATKKLLLVKVIKCRGLSAKDLCGHTADPYVKLYMYPLQDESEIRQTQVKWKTLNPTYHEIIPFPILDNSLTDGVMVVQVWDKDIMDRDDLIGESIIRLNVFEFERSPIHTAWYALQAETDLEITGDLDLCLSYDLPSTLKVTVHRGHNLTNHYQGGQDPSPFVRVQIPGTGTLYETQVKEDTVNPSWEESFEFTVPTEEFSDRYIIFHVIDCGEAKDNDSLGQIVIELKNFNPESGFSGNFELADLKNSERLRAKWFQHATVQEFREALLAHTTFRQPKFLFQKHDGTKTIRLTSRKAGSQAKLRIVDGIPVY